MLPASLPSRTVFLCCLLATSFLEAKEKKFAIGLIGDSTVASTYGWGPSFARQAKDPLSIANAAKNGATLESLSQSLDKLLTTEPDYVLVQFGHNDMKRYAASVYSRKLANYIDRIKRSGSKPIVLSSVTRRRFDEQGKIKPVVINDRTLPEFAAAARAVAQEKDTPFIDLNAISIAHHNQIGAEASAAYNFKATDTTHFSDEGADAIAALLIAELTTVVPELAPYFHMASEQSPADDALGSAPSE